MRPLALLLLAAVACDSDRRTSGDGAAAAPPTSASPASAGGAVATGAATVTATVVRRWPHDPAAFTEGLEYHDGSLLESTGTEGQSYLRLSDLATGRVLRTVPLDKAYFGEGSTIFGGKAYQLTWKSQKGFIYDAATFRPLGTFTYAGEGWGLTHDSTSLIMSNGTSELHYLDPKTLKVTRTLPVTDNGRPVDKLNELEIVKGQIYANVWTTDQIARIDPQTGRVTGWIDLTGLLAASERQPPVDVLNGIAYDAKGDRLFVTGKYWPAIFEVRAP